MTQRQYRFAALSQGDKVMDERVTARLRTFGYIAESTDEAGISFAQDKATKHLLNLTNRTDVPPELEPTLIDMICGEFLLAKYTFGQLDISTIDLTGGAVKQITEGDTTVSFNDSDSDNGKFTAYINRMINPEGSDWLRFRKLMW